MKRWTIRWRLTFWNAVVLAALFCLLSIAMLSAVHRHLVHQADQFLMEEIQELIKELRNVEDHQALLAELTVRYAVHHYHLQVLDAEGRPVFRSHILTQVSLPVPAPVGEMRGHRYEDLELPPAGEFRLMSMAIRDSHSRPLLLQILAPRSALRQEFQWYVVTVLTALPIAILISIVTGYFLARQSLSPLEKMAFTAERISGEKLDQRLEVRNPDDELGRLASTLNGMFDRLSVSMSQMRQFTSDAAHELRSPLAALRTQAEVALRAGRTTGEYQKVVRETLEETTHMSELVDQLLLLSRHDSGQQSVIFEETRVDQILLDVIERFYPMAIERGLRWKAEGLCPWILPGDDVWLSQLFWNLLDNASKYTPRGGEICVTSRIMNGQWSCSIQDTGVGIAEHHLPRIFDRFYRVDVSRTRSAGGTGLGLAICKSIVEAHQGRIEVASVVVVGTVFTISLPGRPAELEIESSDSDSVISSEVSVHDA